MLKWILNTPLKISLLPFDYSLLKNISNRVTFFFFLQEQCYKKKSLDFDQKKLRKAKNKARLAVPQNVRTKCLN